VIPYEDLPRHSWVWLKHDWRDGLVGDCSARMSDWCDQERPLVVARRDSDEAVLRLGLALPGRERHAMTIRPGAVARSEAPLPVENCLPAAPPGWRPAMRWLQTLDCPVAIYGSLAWQARLSDPELVYLSEASDLDLLLAPTRKDRLGALLARLEEGAASFPDPRWDGEIILPDGGAVAWRECLAASGKLLVKYHGALALRPRQDLLQC
jgi:phosphoribosyl-dephospho-CoA transferase